MPNDSATGRTSTLALWIVLAAPLVAMTYGYLADRLVYGEYIQLTGEWSARLLILAMALTPLRRMFPRVRLIGWLFRRRRYFGVATFTYAFAHLVAYLIRLGVLERILDESLEPGMLAGWVALLVFVPLAITSNDLLVSKLGRRWKSLHRWVYLAALLTFGHWVLVAFDPVPGYLHAGVLLLLEVYRIGMNVRDRRASQSSAVSL